MINIFTILLYFSMLTATVANAAALGLPENTAKFGYAAGIGYVSIDNPKGRKSSTFHALPFNVFYNDWLTDDIRYWAEAFYYKASMDAKTDRIGQNINHYGLRLTAQKSLRISPLWAPWFGAGIELSQAKYTERHLVDSDGYLLEAFADDKETLLALILNMTNEWPFRRNWAIGAKIEQSIPIQGSLTNSMATLMIVYRY
jgi:hypothetical protein